MIHRFYIDFKENSGGKIKIAVKAIKVKENEKRYRIHKSRLDIKPDEKSKVLNELQALKHCIYCIYHDSVVEKDIDKKIHNGEKIQIIHSLNRVNFKLINQANAGKQVYQLLSTITTDENATAEQIVENMRQRELIKEILIALQKIYKHSNVKIEFLETLNEENKASKLIASIEYMRNRKNQNDKYYILKSIERTPAEQERYEKSKALWNQQRHFKYADFMI